LSVGEEKMFSWSFLTSHSETVKPIKNAWKEAVLEMLPNELRDPIALDILEEPVFTTENGDVFSKTTLDSHFKAQKEIKRNDNCDLLCPLTRANLKESDLKFVEKKIVRAPLLANIIACYIKERDSVIKYIEDISSKELASEIKKPEMVYRKHHSGVKKKMKHHKEFIQKCVKEFKSVCRVMTFQQIELIKSRLMLDINNETHLKWWSEPKGCCGLGLIKVQHKNKSYMLSKRVYELLIMANKGYNRVSDFYRAIDQVKKSSELSHWNQFWGKTTKSEMVLKPDISYQKLDLSWVKPR
jgi:hypothetical protein